jgi:hypothetical protein
MDVAAGQLGAEGAWDLKLEGGKAILSIKHTHASGEMSFEMKEDARYFFEKLKALIPGNFDDMLISVAESALP